MTPEDEKLQFKLLQETMADTGALVLSVGYLLAEYARKDKDPQAALRNASNTLQSIMDLMPVKGGSAISDLYFERHREMIDNIISAARRFLHGLHAG